MGLNTPARLRSLLDTRSGRAVLVALMLSVFFIIAFSSARQKSATADEGVHLARGICILHAHDFRMSIHHPPLMNMICALPVVYLSGRTINFPYQHPSWAATDKTMFWRVLARVNKENILLFLSLGRLPVMLLGVMLGYLVYLFARDLYGYRSGLLALFLYCASPTIIAHARLITTDLAVTAGVFATIFSLWKFFQRPSPLRTVILGMVTGLALLTKYSALLLAPICLVIPACMFMEKEFRTRIVQEWKKFPVLRSLSSSPISAALLVSAIIFVVIFMVIWAGYGFEMIPVTGPMKELHTLFNILPENTPLPLLRYTYGFFATREILNSGANYFFGQISDKGFHSYYVIMFLLKTPIPVILLFSLALFRGDFSANHRLTSVLIFLPMLVWFLAASFLNDRNLGIRYVLPVYPLIHVWISGMARESLKTPKWLKGVLVILLVWAVAACVWIWPHFLMYFNPIASGPDQAYRVAVAGEDWGQDLKGLGKFCKENGIEKIWYHHSGMPSLYGVNHQAFPCYEKVPGWVAVHLIDLYRPRDPGCYNWIKEYEPVEKIGYTIYVYKIPEE